MDDGLRHDGLDAREDFARHRRHRDPVRRSRLALEVIEGQGAGSVPRLAHDDPPHHFIIFVR